MSGVILGWNPDKWNSWNPDYDSVVSMTESGLSVIEDWGIGNTKRVPIGSDAWLLRQGEHGRGLIGHGTTRSLPLPGPSAVDPSREVMQVVVEFDLLLPVAERVLPDRLTSEVPGIAWTHLQKNGTLVGGDSETQLRSLWERAVSRERSLSPIDATPGTYMEGAVIRVAVNKYERDPKARAACLAHHGIRCAACDMSFEERYGSIGSGFIHVHHLTMISQVGEEYVVDPVRDLVPLCANCHNMAHRRSPLPYSPAELRQLMSRAIHER